MQLVSRNLAWLRRKEATSRSFPFIPALPAICTGHHLAVGGKEKKEDEKAFNFQCLRPVLDTIHPVPFQPASWTQTGCVLYAWENRARAQS